MQQTTNYGMNLPEATDYVDIETINENFRTIDTVVKAAEESGSGSAETILTEIGQVKTAAEEIRTTGAKESTLEAVKTVAEQVNTDGAKESTLETVKNVIGTAEDTGSSTLFGAIKQSGSGELKSLNVKSGTQSTSSTNSTILEVTGSGEICFSLASVLYTSSASEIANYKLTVDNNVVFDIDVKGYASSSAHYTLMGFGNVKYALSCGYNGSTYYSFPTNFVSTPAETYSEHLRVYEYCSNFSSGVYKGVPLISQDKQTFVMNKNSENSAFQICFAPTLCNIKFKTGFKVECYSKSDSRTVYSTIGYHLD